MKRVSVYLSEESIEYLRRRAKEEGKSVSAVIREIIEKERRKHLLEEERRRKLLENLPEKMDKNDPIFNIIGMGSGGGEDVASNYKEYLYGKKRKND